MRLAPLLRGGLMEAMRRFILALGVLTIASLLTYSGFGSARATVTTNESVAPGAGYFGAFAYSPSHHYAVEWGGGKTALAAEDNALAACRTYDREADCIPVAWYYRTYASFAVGSGTGSHQAWGWGYSATQAGADQIALNECSNNGSGCVIVMRHVTSSPRGSSQSGIDLTGRVCMVNAPSGGVRVGKIFISGHVGWAFLVNRDTGSWIYGATERASGVVGASPAVTWYRDGTWGQLTIGFARKLGDLHPANYYKSLRCESLPAGSGAAAFAEVEYQQGKTYDIPYNDCLSDAVIILRDYGATGLGTNPYKPLYPNAVPNWYYSHALNGFSPTSSVRS